MLEDSGGGLLGNAGGGGTSESVFHASFQDLLEFIQQTGVTDNAQVGFSIIHFLVNFFLFSAKPSYKTIMTAY